MGIIDQVKEAERKAEEGKINAKKEAGAVTAAAEENARTHSAELLAEAKQFAVEALEEARQTAAENTVLIKAASDRRNQELAETAASNQEKAAALVLSFL